VRNRDYKTVIRNDKPPINGMKCKLEGLRSNRTVTRMMMMMMMMIMAQWVWEW
jgi:hypothetical protein